MDRIIDKLLEKTEFSSQVELKAFVSEVQSKITIYEKVLYQEDQVDSVNLKKIKAWRNKLLTTLKMNKELPIEEKKEEKEGLEALSLLNRQVEMADVNQKILKKSTLKVMSLDYSSKELEQAILDTNRKFEKNAKKESLEGRNLIFMFILFLSVCLAIILDKLYLKLKAN
jgi:hypothetical protein